MSSEYVAVERVRHTSDDDGVQTSKTWESATRLEIHQQHKAIEENIRKKRDKNRNTTVNKIKEIQQEVTIRSFHVKVKGILAFQGHRMDPAGIRASLCARIRS